MNRFQFVADHQRRHGVKRLCQVLGIARSSYYHWKATTPDRVAAAAADARLAARIRVIHRESAGTYGVPRVTAELRAAGHPVNHKRVARVMREAGLAGLRLRRRHRTTLADQTAAKAPDLLGRDFTAPTPNTRYHGWPCSVGCTATTPDDATPTSATCPPSTTRTASPRHRLR